MPIAVYIVDGKVDAMEIAPQERQDIVDYKELLFAE